MSKLTTIVELARTLPVYGEFDVVVVGGGPAGLAASTSAARNGARVLLVERYGFLGGMGTAGGVTNFAGLYGRKNGEMRQVVHGVVDEVLEHDVREDERDGGDEAHRGGEEGEADGPGLGGDVAGVALAGGLADGVEGVDHADDRAEQADHRGDLGDGEDRGEQGIQPRQHFEFRGRCHAPPHGCDTLLGGFEPGHIQHARDQPAFLLAEADRPGSMVGETFQRILLDQFTRVRDGDRFWYEKTMSPEMVRMINAQTLSVIIHRNTEIKAEVGKNAFMAPPPPQAGLECRAGCR